MRSRYVPAALLPVALAALPAADPPKPAAYPTAFECRWADSPITPDGADDEPAWRHAQPIDSFHLPWLGADDRPAKTATRAKLLWDREYLYFFADMDDADLFADVTEHDGNTWDNDVFELFFRPDAGKPGYFEFQVNAAGTVFDCFFPKYDLDTIAKQKTVGEFRVESKVKLRGTLNKRTDADAGWSVEGRIPWTDFLRAGGRPEPGESWRFTLCRYDYHKDWKDPELSTVAPISKKRIPAFFHQTEDYATLTFVGLDAKSAATPLGIPDRGPVTTSTVVGSPDPPLPYRVKRLYPNFSPAFPIMVKAVPGTGHLVVITQDRPYAPSSVYVVKDDPAVTTADAVKLTDTPAGGTAYDVAFHPKFADNGYVYVGWNGKPDGRKENVTRVTRYTMARTPPHALDPKSAATVIEWESNGHNGGALCFGTDSMLYVTSGDGTSDSDTNLTGQRTDLLLAKVLRIDVDGGKPYAVPKDNPFVGDKRFAPETWAYGLRNPWRITCDEKTGHIWVGNNGQDLWEQAYFVRKGENYGWSVMEGGHPFYEKRTPGPTPFTKPTIEHHHAEFRSLTGGVVYHGDRLPGLAGAYVYGDYSTGRVWGMRHDGTKPLWHTELASTRFQITAFGSNSRGELLILDHRAAGESGLYTLEPTPKDSPPSTFPRKLSDSGLFDSVKGHRMMPGVIPYSVNAPFWSDGMQKARYLALPPGETIGFTRWRGWNFPDKTVIVKSFALEGTDPPRWVETRFLTKQGAEWFGYTYLWNDQGTDAELVPAGGLDKEYEAAGRKQTWHYPSRAECLVCHSRAQNFVLGLCESQMNKTHDYAGKPDEQFRVLEHLGVLSADWAAEAKATLSKQAAAKGLKGPAADEYVKLHSPQPGQRQPKASSLLHQSPAKFDRLADPYDPTADLGKRARSWLHANCSSCHVEAGGGNARLELEFATALEKMRLLDEKPVHQTFDLPDARLVAAGHPERSVLVKRVGLRGPGQMPPLSSNRVDEAGLRLLGEWVRSLK